MSNRSEKALLPAGLSDVLPPEASHEAAVQERILGVFAGYGYDRVKPPLIEFEDNLLNGSGVAMTEQTFRLMDPISQRMMGLRADMTLQVARIAASRLQKHPRPLRLSYAGQVLRVKGTQLRPERQFGQVGAELIGDTSVTADAEVILMAVESLYAVGVCDLSVDLCLPTLVPAVCRGNKHSKQTSQRLRLALDRKDAAGVKALESELGKSTTNFLTRLLTAVGTADQTLGALKKLRLPKPAATELSRLAATVKAIRNVAPDIVLTIDPVENRGFEYHTGVTFTLFAKSIRGELGSGGRYHASINSAPGEAATGLTLFMDTVLRAVPTPPEPRRIFLPYGTSTTLAKNLRADGWVTIAEFKRSAKPEVAAFGLRCTHILKQDLPALLPKNKQARSTIRNTSGHVKATKPKNTRNRKGTRSR